MQSVSNDVSTFAATAKVYFNKSVYTVNESDAFINIDVVASRRYFSDKFSVETRPYVNKTLKPYYGNCLILQLAISDIYSCIKLLAAYV